MKIKDKLSNLWEDAVCEIGFLADEMRSWEEGMGNSEGLSATSKYQIVSDTADTLEDANDTLNELKISENLLTDIIEIKQIRKKRMTRYERLSNSLIIFDILLGKLPDGDEKEELQEVFTNLECVEFPSMFG